MGNTTVVASGVKNQGDAAASTLYQLVDLKGGGELVDLMKVARWTKNYTELDQKIQTEVAPFLYDGGKGRYIPILELVEKRNKDRQKSGIKASKNKQKSAQDQAMLDHLIMEEYDVMAGNTGKQEPKTRFQCWDLEKRGTVGETILHLCLLNATQIHADLAKRLLHFFPNMINDIYSGEEYYGETVLHIAIVNEDPAMVKFLLDKGADVQSRASGNFFTPDDQKGSRTDSLDHEWVDVCTETNYEGYVYWGDFPLGFATCLDQEECVRLLLAKGADPNKQDANGNTCMHMLVIHDNLQMFDLLYGQGGRLDIRNRQNLSPLTLAAKLARKDMYEHILEIIREVYWLYGNVTSAGYPLDDIDTISDTGEINCDSALHLIVYGEDEGHLNMMDGLIVTLLQEKWKTFARARFYRRFALFIIYFIVFMVAYSLRPGVDLCAFMNDTSTLSYCDQQGIDLVNRTVNPCYLLKPYRNEDVARLVMEVIVLISAIIYIFLALKEVYHQGFNIFFSTLTGAPAKTLFLLSCVFVILMLPGRASCNHEFEDIIGVLAILCTSPYFLFFCRGFRIVGPFVVMIYNMIKGDLLRFFIIYAVFVIGFSQAMHIIFMDQKGSAFAEPIESIMAMFIMSLGQFGDFYDSYDSTNYAALGKAIFMIYMVMVTLLLVNMLIAMMGHTYELVSNTQKEWFRQWAKIVLVVEQTVTTKCRREQMLKYSVPYKEKQRALMIRWHQTQKEKEELARLRKENKIAQRSLAMRKSMMTIKPNSPISRELAGIGQINI
ncbi:transient receptor potential cation channel subfamily V member 5 isoform X2 [Aplysia californica]|uniref:Transient receptor potential cation channel subfamily V member 5 isoform X2 n=1 Tax=Aplysia californica TaxID=6500 RepID=A0ABM1W054_APLCA|nr:transient receptor potential cation channel subfamily V member 5 isoform X2 [Aplysia californica]